MPAVYQLHPRVALRAVAGEAFVVTDDRAFHHARVSTAADLLQALREGPRTADELTDVIVARYRVDRETARADVERFVAILVERMVAVRTESPG